MKISFVTTVFNEGKEINTFLDSLTAQTKKPDEINIVDGGSTDSTVSKIKEWKNKNRKLRIKLLIRNGTTIAQGRNEAIKEATGEIIAMADAGCIIHPDWLEKITEPFTNSRVDIVAGFYRMTGESVFQKCLASYLGITPQKLNPENFMPSARSMAFRKKVWEEIGGFNENLERAGEDTLFNYQAKKLGFSFQMAKDALVDWKVPASWKEAIKKFYYYAKGDGQIGVWWHPSQRVSTHNLKISAIYGRYFLVLTFLIFGFSFKILWLVLLVSFIFYLIWAIRKNYQFVKIKQAIFLLPMMQIISDLAVMFGFFSGIINRVNKK